MRKKFFLNSILLLTIILSVVFQFSLQNFDYHSLGDEITLNESDLESIRPDYPITMQLTRSEDENIASYKLLDFLPLKQVKINFSPESYVYLGGIPVGITLGNDGLVIIGVTDVITSEGKKTPCAGLNLQNGDILYKVDNQVITRPDEIDEIVENSKNDEVIITIRNGNQLRDIAIKPAVDALSGKKRLGLWLNNGISGIGTLTYVTNDLDFGALGHPIHDAEGTDLSNATGSIYPCNILGSIKGERGKAGELRGTFSSNDKPTGHIDKNCKYGIFGKAESEMIEHLNKIKLGSRNIVKPGKAYVFTTVMGEKPAYYEIEIVKAQSQREPQEKGMVIRVTDERLLSLTGGIVQGMSGSPIIQNNRLVGAVSHVFINDPTKGFGMYVDWMLNN